MAILDKLLEKKQILCYIRARKAYLIQTARKRILEQEPKKRELIKQKISGRIRELERLNAVLNQNELKEATLRDWPAIYAKKCQGEKR